MPAAVRASAAKLCRGDPSGVSADTYRPHSSVVFTFSGTLFAWWGPKRIEQAQALPAAVRASAAKLCRGDPSGVSADTYRPHSSVVFTFSGTLFAWWGPKRIEQAQALPAAVRAREQIYLRRFAEAPAGKRQFAAKLCRGAPSGVSADTYRPPSSSFFTFSGTLFAWWGPKRIEQAQALPAPVRAREQIYLRRFAEAPEGKRQFAAKLCLVVARLRTRRVSPFSETRSPAAAPPLPKKSLRMQIFFGSPFIPKGNGRYLPSPFFVIFTFSGTLFAW